GFRYAGANLYEPRYANGFEILGVHRGWTLSNAHKKEAHRSLWILNAPLKLEPGDRISLTFKGAKVGCVRISLSPFAPETPTAPGPSPALREALTNPQDAARPDALRAYLLGTAWN